MMKTPLKLKHLLRNFCMKTRGHKCPEKVHSTKPGQTCFSLRLHFGFECYSTHVAAFSCGNLKKHPSTRQLLGAGVVFFSLWNFCFFFLSSSHFNLFHSIQALFHVIQPFCADVGRGEKEHIWVLILAFRLAFCVTATAQKRKRWRGAREVINCFLSLKRDGKEGWLWGLVDLLLHLFRCTDTITETYKNTLFIL